jgi:hypothetical protein
MEFYFTFLPCLERDNPKILQKVFITSNVRTKVKLTVEATNYEEIQYTVPNDIIEFSLKPTKCMPFRKKEGAQPDPEYIEPNSAVHIESDDPIICYALTDNESEKQSEGFLVYPLHTLGKEYITTPFSSMNKAYALYKYHYFPAYTSILSPYDSTKIKFIMGGNDWSETPSGLVTGDTAYWNMNSGDILLISTNKKELSGLYSSIINSNNPIAVISGNYCTTLNDKKNMGAIEEMELPSETWGHISHYIPIRHLNNESWYKIFTADTNATYKINDVNRKFFNPGGYQMELGAVAVGNNITFTSNNRINLAVYNIGNKYSSSEMDPFHMTTLTIEQYQYEMTLMTPGKRGEKRYPDNYLNICFSSDKSGKVPNDLQIGIFDYKSNKYVWSRLNESLATQSQLFTTPSTENYYAATTVKLPSEGVFKLRADKPFQAYSYGFSAFDGYGFPSSASLKKLGKNDNFPPVPEWNKDCNGNVNSEKNVFVYDMPYDTANRSNLALIYMHSDVSFNYKFNLEKFFPCDSSQAEWSLDIIDSTQDALAVITFADCYGNDTTIVIEHYHKITLASDSVLNNQNIVLGNDYWKQFSVKNNSVNTWNCDDYKFKNNQGFSLWDLEKTGPLTKPFKVNPNDSIQFFVKCDGKKEGEFADSLGFGNDCEFSYDIALNTKVGIPILEVKDLTFNPSNINDTITGKFTIKNIGSVNLDITGIKGPNLKGTSKKKIFMLSGIDIGKISRLNPLVLAEGEEMEITIAFAPDDTIHFSDSIVFNSNSFKQDSKGNTADSICRLSGTGGINISVRDNRFDNIKIYPNPVEDILMIDNLPVNTIKIQIFDETGKEVRAIENMNQSEILKISTKELNIGTYVLRIFVGNDVLDRKFVVVR